MIRIERLAVEAYRSLYEVNLEPRPLTVVVGPNNSGKSNLVDAMDFLGEVHRHGLEIAIQRKGGFENIAHRRMRRTRRPVAFRVEAVVPFDPTRSFAFTTRRNRTVPHSGVHLARADDYWVRVRHEFEMRAESQAITADYAVTSEILTFDLIRRDEAGPGQASLLDSSDHSFLSLTRTEAQVVVNIVRPSSLSDRAWDNLSGPLADKEFAGRIEQLVSPTELLLARIPFVPAYEALAKHLGAIRVYQLSPLESRRAGVPTPNADLDRHGANLPALVDFMKRHNNRAWRSVLSAVQRILPDLDDIRVVNTPDRRLALTFVEKGVGRPWTADEVSDGTIQSVALFAALHDPRSTSIIIEEPENSVHPWILRVFVDACREVSGKTIVLTTHSPVVIDYVQPEELQLMWRVEGRSHLAGLESVDADALRLWESGQIGLFEIIDGGWIRHSVPVADI